jgi:hypothetical protein
VALASQVAGAFSEGIVVIDVLGVLLWMKTNNSLLWYSITLIGPTCDAPLRPHRAGPAAGAESLPEEL